CPTRQDGRATPTSLSSTRSCSTRWVTANGQAKTRPGRREGGRATREAERGVQSGGGIGWGRGVGRKAAPGLGWSGRLLFLAAEMLPGSQELPAQLRHAARRETVPVRHVQRSLALQEVIDDPTVALAAAANPGGKVEPEALT